MKPSRSTLLIGAAVAGVGLFALVAGTLALYSLTQRDSGTPVRIQRSYDEVKGSDGHLAHLSTRQVACRDCHEVVEDEGGEIFSTPTAEVCATCHQDQVGEIHAQSELGRAAADCLACHDFIGDQNIRPYNCIRCHDQPQGFTRAIETHAEADCASCHRPHDQPSLVPRGCNEVGCHADITGVRHGGEVMDGQCLDCHQVHDTRTEAAARCADCHLRTEPMVSLAAIQGGHTYTSCHTPHQFTGDETTSCESCHGNKKTLADNTSRQHDRCESCHQPHNPVARGDASCKRCHSQVVPRHGNAPDCLGCHPVHDGTLAGTAVACSSCHDQGASDKAHGGDLTCQQCHPPHRFDAVQPPPRSCATCHPAQVMISRGTGHADCTQCHGNDPAHRPSDAPSCGSCHPVQARTVTTGHGDCASCHQAHRGSTAGAPTCATCHTAQSRGHHANIPGGCLNCHQVHAPGGVPNPPSCESCHPVARLPALHQVQRHQQCASCHQSHEQRPRADRATCIACHQDMRDHEPAAKRCDGCHLFTGSP
jgi:hypothetical protein